jgi:nucleotide-binding universal stress UspA family protein
MAVATPTPPRRTSRPHSASWADTAGALMSASEDTDAGYKTILTHVPVGVGSSLAIAPAAGIAQKFGGALLGIGASPMVMMPDPSFGFADGEVLNAVEQQIEADLKAAGEVFRKAARAAAVQAEWRSFVAEPIWAMAEQSRAADLIVSVRPEGGYGPADASPGDLLMTTGLPVLVQPTDVEVGPHTVLIAWKNTRETRRAVADALPFLKRARRVVIAAVLEYPERETAVSEEIADLIERLRRHGVGAEADVATALQMGASKQLLAIAESQGADLIVAGAYGHTRVREWVFGGVTHDLLHGSPKPVLFSR